MFNFMLLKQVINNWANRSVIAHTNHLFILQKMIRQRHWQMLLMYCKMNRDVGLNLFEYMQKADIPVKTNCISYCGFKSNNYRIRSDGRQVWPCS